MASLLDQLDNATFRSSGLVRAALDPRRLERALALPSGPPFATVAAYVAWWQRVRANRISAAQYQTAVERANARADAIEARVNERLARVWQESRWSERAARALATGQELAEQSGLTDAGAPGLAVSFGVGFAMQALPLDVPEFLTDWRAILAGLEPAERWVVLAGTRRMVDSATTRQGGRPTDAAGFYQGGWTPAPWPAWRSNYPGNPFHSAFSAAADRSVIPGVFMLEDAVLYDCFPDDSSADARAYALALLCAYHTDAQRVRDMRDLYGKATTGRFGSRWLGEALVSEADTTCGELRARAVARGIADYGQRVLTPRILAAFGG